jgi:hypothetical protein
VAVFNAGTTSVDVVATDSNGQQSSCSFSVTVVDQLDPVVSCPSDFTVFTTPGSCQNTVSYSNSASDNCALASTTIYYPSPFVFLVETTKVVFLAKDTSGRFATCDFTVTVVDNIQPTLGCGPCHCWSVQCHSDVFYGQSGRQLWSFLVDFRSSLWVLLPCGSHYGDLRGCCCWGRPARLISWEQRLVSHRAFLWEYFSLCAVWRWTTRWSGSLRQQQLERPDLWEFEFGIHWRTIGLWRSVRPVWYFCLFQVWRWNHSGVGTIPEWQESDGHCRTPKSILALLFLFREDLCDFPSAFPIGPFSGKFLSPVQDGIVTSKLPPAKYLPCADMHLRNGVSDFMRMRNTSQKKENALHYLQ